MSEETTQYEVELTRHNVKTVTVDASSPEDAAAQAEEGADEGFVAADVYSLGAYFVVSGRCEGCSKVMFDGDGTLTADDVELCVKCFNKMATAARVVVESRPDYLEVDADD